MSFSRRNWSYSGPLIPALVIAVATGWLAVEAVSQAPPPGTSAAATEGGYSIFHETMVDMSWPEVEQAAAAGAVVLMTTAVIEEHGPHMGCGIDAYLGYLMCKLTRRELETRGVRTVIAPPFFWGVNASSHVFAGTFTVRPETMKALLQDLLASLKDMGFRRVFNINAHGDGQHIRTAIQALVEARKGLGIDVRYLMSEGEAKRAGITGSESLFLVHKEPPAESPSSPYLDLHAGAWETGAVAAFFPKAVDMNMARTLEPTRVTAKEIGEWVKDMKKVTPLGYLGDPARFDAEEGRKSLEDGCRMMADAIVGILEKER